MEEQTANADEWGISLVTVICEACDRKYLLPSGKEESKCPHCFTGNLVILSDDPVDVQPELYLPFKISDTGLSQSIQSFMQDLWFPPADLSIVNLRQRLRRVYLPVWLADSHVKAQWQAEAGFNYKVISHQDRFDEARGGWSSREVEETRARWEPRLGRITKDYQNIAVPALDKHSLLMNQLGEYSYEQALAYDRQRVLGPNSSEAAFIRLADRSQKEAWVDAVPHIQNLAAENCRQACASDHIRNFTWTPEFENQHWTLLLLPAYTTYYLDDQKIPQSLLIHGQTGRLFGARRASMLRARTTALWMAGIALAIFIISLFVALGSTLLPALLAFSTIGWGISILLAVGAIVPLVMVWWTNRIPNSFTG